MAKSKRKRLWLARHRHKEWRASASLYLGGATPEQHPAGYFYVGTGSTHVCGLCVTELRRICGVTLKPGEVRAVESIVFTFAKGTK